MKLKKTANANEVKIQMSRKEWYRIGHTQQWNKKAQFSSFSRNEHLTLGPTPAAEDCAQLGSDNYREKSRIEGRAYINQLKRMFPELLPTMKFMLKGFPHDFGTYYEVIVRYPMDDEQAEMMAFDIENSIPENWDDAALAELQAAGHSPFEKDMPAEEITEDTLTDPEADAMTLRDAGWGTDEDYGPGASETL
jgi:hypothetical protein